MSALDAIRARGARVCRSAKREGELMVLLW